MKEEKIIRVMAIMLAILKRVNLPAKGQVEEDFQKRFEDILNEIKMEYLPKVHTAALFSDEERKKQDDWEIDIVLEKSDVYIPIELKFRHGDQNISGYDKLYEWDIRRISGIVDTYKDVPLGYAIFVTDNADLIKNIKKFCDDWFDLKDDYKACIFMHHNTKSTSKIPFGLDYIISGLEKIIK